MSLPVHAVTRDIFQRVVGPIKAIVDQEFDRDCHKDDSGHNKLISIREEYTVVGFGLLRQLALEGKIAIEEETSVVDMERLRGIFEDFTKHDPKFQYRDFQLRCAEKAIFRKRGIIWAAPGAGKTEVISACSRYYTSEDNSDRVLVCNNRTKIIRQIVQRMIKRGVPKDQIAIAGEKNWTKKRIVVGNTTTVNNLIQKGDPAAAAFFKEVVALIFDEAHHGAADSWKRITKHVAAPNIHHFTGTPYEIYRDPLSNLADAQLMSITGGVVISISSSYLRKKGYLAHPIVHFLDYPNTFGWVGGFDWGEIERKVINSNQGRNQRAVQLIKILDHFGVKTLVIVQKINHGYDMMEALRAEGVDASFSMGGEKIAFFDPVTGNVDYRTSTDSFNDHYFESSNVLIGSSIFDEGVDVPTLEAGVNLAGGKASRKSIQRVSRIIRAKPDPTKNFGFWFDFEDQFNPVTKKHSRLRREIYQDEAYKIYDDFDDVIAMIKHVKGLTDV